MLSLQDNYADRGQGIRLHLKDGHEVILVAGCQTSLEEVMAKYFPDVVVDPKRCGRCVVVDGEGKVRE